MRTRNKNRKLTQPFQYRHPANIQNKFAVKENKRKEIENLHEVFENDGKKQLALLLSIYFNIYLNIY